MKGRFTICLYHNVVVGVEVEARCGALLALLPLFRALRVRLGKQPKPRIIVDHLHLLTVDEHVTGPNDTSSIGEQGVGVTRPPLLEVDEHAVVGLAVLADNFYHVDLFDLAKLEPIEDSTDARLANVLKHPRDADARKARRMGVHSVEHFLNGRGGRVAGGHFWVSGVFLRRSTSIKNTKKHFNFL